jgi:hypothetical protein
VRETDAAIARDEAEVLRDMEEEKARRKSRHDAAPANKTRSLLVYARSGWTRVGNVWPDTALSLSLSLSLSLTHTHTHTHSYTLPLCGRPWSDLNSTWVPKRKPRATDTRRVVPLEPGLAGVVGRPAAPGEEEVTLGQAVGGGRGDERERKRRSNKTSRRGRGGQGRGREGQGMGR